MDVPVLPTKTDSPLLVNTDTPLSGSFAGQLLKTVTRLDTKEIEARGAVELLQLTLPGSLSILRQLGREVTAKELFRFLAGKGYNHGGIVTRCGSIVKR